MPMPPALFAAAAAVAFLPAFAFRHADMVPVRARGGFWFQDALRKDRESGALFGAAASMFPQLIWHNDSAKGTFDQRFFSDKTNATSGLCLLYIGGEGPAGGPPGG